MTHRFPAQPYSVFQTEDDVLTPDVDQSAKQGRFGFLGRVVEGTGIVAVSLTVAILAMTTAARADEVLLARATELNTGAMMITLGIVFAGMLVAVRQTWRQTSKGIADAPRRSHRVS